MDYVKGKDDEIAHYLSRNPLWSSVSSKYGPWIIDDFRKEVTMDAHISVI